MVSNVIANYLIDQNHTVVHFCNRIEYQCTRLLWTIIALAVAC